MIAASLANINKIIFNCYDVNGDNDFKIAQEEYKKIYQPKININEVILNLLKIR